MPSYRIHRLKDHLHQSFRLAPHVSGTAHVKPRDYELAESVESIDAATPYAAFFALKDTEGPLLPATSSKPKTGPCASTNSSASKKPNGSCRKPSPRPPLNRYSSLPLSPKDTHDSVTLV